jgi:hypothetical protein
MILTVKITDLKQESKKLNIYTKQKKKVANKLNFSFAEILKGEMNKC